ncbi:transcriptional coactivator p15/PC4 family protein [Methylobacterium oxalidis]|uniref:Transcriptional coactivator p15 (PC4) C-terminal domain-containing protein n=1 Tax=Methylobacterium oxalidis TaxID=944322 RepID=A0A512J4F1_9HYPH|nr:transcriptional coactivator p15/PC4 family protein [Methylobacterium oxalidis]GEP04831.1 hypothetical protein MOX02_28690 [Methylobacterium oxalidis]GJE30525.1 hypothetical protein LDDCCGHA_0693 [Methylobacterium oxalidis]GLS63656.1 hypothetical protein GCM10007888_20370 [Methylobacterium oxalidis]
MSQPRTFATLRKGNSGEIRIRLAEYQGTQMVDVRLFSPRARSCGEPLPTKQGVCIARHRLRELIAGLQAIERDGSGR